MGEAGPPRMSQNRAHLSPNHRAHRKGPPAGPRRSRGSRVHVSHLGQMLPKRESDQCACLERTSEGEPDRQELARAGEGPLPEGVVEI